MQGLCEVFVTVHTNRATRLPSRGYNVWMVTTLSTKRDIPPSDPKQLADWLAPRPGETYEEWSRRFDSAEKKLAKAKAVNPTTRVRQPRTRTTQSKRRAA